MKKEQKLIFRLLPLLIAAVIAALLPQMIRNEYYMTIACQILIYLIAVCGLNFITGLTGQMNLGTAGMFAMGAYVSGLLNVKLGVSPWLSEPAPARRVPLPDDHRLHGDHPHAPEQHEGRDERRTGPARHRAL